MDDILNEDHLESEIMSIRREKFSNLKDKGKNPFEMTGFDFDFYAKDIIEQFESLEGKTVKISGRITSKRDMGKASFMDVSDSSGKIQVYLKINDIGEEEFKEINSLWDIGDIVGVEGFVFKTRRGEVSVHATKLTLLAKSFLPLPEKFHGLRDT